MSVFSYHIATVSYFVAVRALLFPPKPANNPGLVHAECMTAMTLGSGIFSPSRMLIRQFVVFAQWESEDAINHFLSKNELGVILTQGWHTRLQFIWRWGRVSEFEIPKEPLEVDENYSPVVAVTLARMKLPQVPRLIRWGRPVKKLVRDHPGTTLSLASIRLPRTISKFSIWKSQKDMIDMVHAHSQVPNPRRHVNAIHELRQKGFLF